jgi:class 3 adenylate cyclase
VLGSVVGRIVRIVPQRASGTVTFLFTDLEGSTRLWEERPELMGAALARHDELVQALIRAHGGTVFSGMGDGVAASFERATDAARAAMEIQAALADEAWPASLGPLRGSYGPTYRRGRGA